MTTTHPTNEHARIASAPAGRPGNWKSLGPWLSERAWGTVREDYSADGKAWEYFPYEQARSRAYRWNEDGLAGICDLEQHMCFALTFWNGRDPFLKERLFGLTGPEGNHGEDVKEYWWYADATPTSSWLQWRYHYPQAAFPYELLRAENARRGAHDREYELEHTGIFDEDRYWQITAEYAKETPLDVCVRIRVRNAGPESAELHVLPTWWFRNRWSWEVGVGRPIIRGAASAMPGTASAVAEEHDLGHWRLEAGPGPDGRAPQLLFCENETNSARLFGSPLARPFPKDGVNDHVVSGESTVNPKLEGTKMACWYRMTVAPNETVELRLRLARDTSNIPLDLRLDYERTFADRLREADEYHASMRPGGTTDEEAAVMRQALAGMVWSQQFYHYDVARWLDGDPTQPAPPATRRRARNAGWRHLNNHDLIAMPDKWEYPWYAAWDLAFHCVVLAHTDPAAAKHQLLLMCREWYMHPNGQLPAYEWKFEDVNPPVHAWATLAVFRIDGGTDFEFLSSAFHKLLINFTWWVNRKDAFGDNIFEGGFLGLDNIGPFDRSAMLPDGDVLEQSDGTAWMGKYCLNMLEMALRLANRDPSYEGVALKFFEHFASISSSMAQLWDDEDGFFYDRLRMPNGSSTPLRARSMVGLLPIFAAVRIDQSLWENLPDFRRRAGWFLQHRPQLLTHLGEFATDGRLDLLALVDTAKLRRVLARMLDESEFFSPFGLRSLSRHHLEYPLIVKLPTGDARLDYEPAESSCGIFGGNSNWRGPIWFPLNFLALESLRNLHECLGERFKVEMPTGSGVRVTLGQVADELETRLLKLFLLDANHERPIYGKSKLFQHDPVWRDQFLFYEYFDGDTGEGLGASHQTGWTALIGTLVANRGKRWRRTMTTQ